MKPNLFASLVINKMRRPKSKSLWWLGPVLFVTVLAVFALFLLRHWSPS
jgi:hypothetical protein